MSKTIEVASLAVGVERIGVARLTLRDKLQRSHTFLLPSDVLLKMAATAPQALKSLPGAIDIIAASPKAEWRLPYQAKARWEKVNELKSGPHGGFVTGLSGDGRVYLALRTPDGSEIELVETAATLEAFAHQLLQMCRAAQTPTSDRLQ